MKLNFKGRQVEVDYKWLGGGYSLEFCYWLDTEQELTDEEKWWLQNDPETDRALRAEAAEFRRGY